MAANFKLVQDLWHITLLIYMHDNACTNADAQTYTNKMLVSRGKPQNSKKVKKFI